MEGAVLAGCYAMGVGIAAVAAWRRPGTVRPEGNTDGEAQAPPKRRRRKMRNTAKRFAGKSDPGSPSTASITSSELCAPLCPHDATCELLNDPEHFERFAHTCRLAKCPSIGDREHRKLFWHPEERDDSWVLDEDDASSVVSTASHSSLLCHDSPLATFITVQWQTAGNEVMRSFTIKGQWDAVDGQALKTYLTTVTAVPVDQQSLFLVDGEDQRCRLRPNGTVGSSGVVGGSTILMVSK